MMVNTERITSERKSSGKALAAAVQSEAVEARWAKCADTLRALGKRKLGSWVALDAALTHADRIEQRLLARILALESEVAEMRGSARAQITAPNSEGERLELELRGEVTRDKCDVLISKINAASLRDEICLRIVDSNGGDHTASLDLAETLLGHKGPTRCIAQGKCHSAAATLYMAADKGARLASHDAEFLIHAGSFANMPPSWTAEFARGHENAESDNLARWFSRRTGKSWFCFRRMMRTQEGETLSVQRAHELGIVSDILPAPARSRRKSKSKRKVKRK
jgi:ATP-dependent protease ClpP protease subunit